MAATDPAFPAQLWGLWPESLVPLVTLPLCPGMGVGWADEPWRPVLYVQATMARPRPGALRTARRPTRVFPACGGGGR
jgi:hypothetical protein